MTESTITGLNRKSAITGANRKSAITGANRESGIRVGATHASPRGAIRWIPADSRSPMADRRS
jgi:hypothetical protein